MERLAERAQPRGKVTIGPTELDQIARQIGGALDPVHGGMRGAPKFPNAQLYELLWRAGLRTGDTRFFDAVDAHAGADLRRRHLRSSRRRLLALFGRREVAGAAFREDAVRQRAASRAAAACLRAHRQRAVPRSGRARRSTWLAQEMTIWEGAFCASLDADSRRRGGQVLRLVDARDRRRRWARTDAAFFARALRRHRRAATSRATTSSTGCSGRSAARPTRARLARLRGKLLGVRSTRVRPGLDDKILADWNGEMIAALVHAGTAFGEPSWIDRARRAFEFIASDMTKGDRLGHSWRAGRLLYPGLASDFANMIRAALALYEATGRARLPRARARLAARVRHALRQSARTADISSPPTTPKAWWCAPARPATTPRRTRTPSPRRTWSGSPR